MKIKTVRYHYTPIRISKIIEVDSTNCWQGCKTKTPLSVAGENAKWYSCFGRQFGYGKVEHNLTIESSNNAYTGLSN